MSETSANGRNESVLFEESDFSARAIRWFVVGLAGLLVFTAIICGAMLWVFLALVPSAKEHLPSLPEARVAMPVLQADPYKDAEQIKLQTSRRLNSYGWVDRNSGIVHIPIERAMRILVDRGMPLTKQVEASPEIPPVKSKPSLPPPVSQRDGDAFGDN